MNTPLDPTLSRRWIRLGLVTGGGLIFFTLLSLLVALVLAACGDHLGRSVALVLGLIGFLSLFTLLAALAILYGLILDQYLRDAESAAAELQGMDEDESA